MTQVTYHCVPAAGLAPQLGADVGCGETGASPSRALSPSAPRAAPGSGGRARARSASPRLLGARSAPSSCDTPRAQHPRTLAQSNPARVTFPLHSAPGAAGLARWLRLGACSAPSRPAPAGASAHPLAAPPCDSPSWRLSASPSLITATRSATLGTLPAGSPSCRSPGAPWRSP